MKFIIKVPNNKSRNSPDYGFIPTRHLAIISTKGDLLCLWIYASRVFTALISLYMHIHSTNSNFLYFSDLVYILHHPADLLTVYLNRTKSPGRPRQWQTLFHLRQLHQQYILW